MMILEKTGMAPLKFDGKLLATGKSFNDDDLDRGYELTIYKSSDDKWISQLKFHSRWKRESNTSRVNVCSNVSDLVAALLANDPLADVVGYPPGKQFVVKQALLLEALKLQYETLVGRVLAMIPETAETLR